MKRSVLGEDLNDNSVFRDMAFRSFLETLIQSLFDLTSDIKEYVRLGRSLWPKYITPVRPKNIVNTVSKLKQAKRLDDSNGNVLAIQREILTFLDQNFFPHMRYALEHGLATLTFDTSGDDALSGANSILRQDTPGIPILVKYLLLAAYICQVNRPEKDRHMFSVEKNGKRRRKNKEQDTGEEVAFGSQDPLKTTRPRIFPLERLYSLYVSIVSLNASGTLVYRSSPEAFDESEMLKSLGDIPFLETLAYLRDIGVFHDFPKRTPTEPIRFSQRHFWTSIASDEAFEIAASIDFPLDRYIL